MKRVLFLLATVSALGMASSAMAQADRSVVRVDRAVPGVERVIPRPAVDTSVIADRLRASGVPESNIELNLERIRAAIQSGNYPNLLRRLHNAGLIGGGDQDPNRRRYLNAGELDETGANRSRFFNANNGDDAATERRRLQAAQPDRDVTDRRVREGNDPLRGIIVLGPARTDRAVRADTAVRVGRGD